MKAKQLIITLLIGILFAFEGNAQTCDPDFTVIAAVTPSGCQSDGSIAVALSGNTANLFNIQYGLQPVSGSGFSIDPQNSDVLTGIPPGKYSITVRAYCSVDASYDVVKTVSNIEVGGNYQVPVASFLTGASRKSYDICNTGTIVLDVSRGSGNYSFKIVDAPSGVTVPATVSATAYYHRYTLDGAYPSGDYTVEVDDGCVVSTVTFTLESISGLPYYEFDYKSFSPADPNPGCGYINWHIGNVPANNNFDYYMYYTDGMYEIGLGTDADTEPFSWQTWTGTTVLSYSLGGHSYADFYAGKSLKAFIRLKGCNNSTETSLNGLMKPTYFQNTAVSYGCDSYTLTWIPWSDYKGMWCYPLSYVMTDSKGAEVLRRTINSRTETTVGPLLYNEKYTLTTTDDQGTVLTGGLPNPIEKFFTATRNPVYSTIVQECGTYQKPYSFSSASASCPVYVTVSDSTTGQTVYSETVSDINEYYIPGMEYGKKYYLTASYINSTVPDFHDSIKHVSNYPNTYHMSLWDADRCVENRGSLIVFSAPNDSYWPVGTVFTVDGPAGYTRQTYTATSSYYYQFPWTDLPPGKYTLTVDHGCGTPITAVLNHKGVYQIDQHLSYTSTVNCSGMVIRPTGTILGLGLPAKAYFRLMSGPYGFDKSVITSSGSITLTQPGTYTLGMMVDNIINLCGLETLTIVYSPQPLQLNTSATSAYVCSGEETGYIKIRGENGSLPYTYELWDETNTVKMPVADIVKHDMTAAYFHYGKINEIYTVRITDDCGNNLSQQVKLSDLSAVSLVYAPNLGMLCQGESIVLQGIYLGETQYNWSGPKGWTASEQNPVIHDAQPDMSGYYTVSVQPDFCGLPMSEQILISVNSLPDAPDVPTPNISLCLYSNPTTLEEASGASASTGLNLKWYNDKGHVINFTGINPSKVGTSTCYVCQENRATGCEGPRVPVTLTVLSKPPQPVLEPIPAICSPSTFSITVKSPLADHQYNLYDNFGNLRYTLPAGQSTFSGLSTYGTWWVTAVSPEGCESYRRPVDVVVYDELRAGAITPAKQLICRGSTPVIPTIASATGGKGNGNDYTYRWQIKTGADDWQNLNGMLPVLNDTALFRVIIADDGNYCGIVVSDTARIDVRPPLLLNYPDIRVSVCPSGTSGLNLSKYLDTLDLPAVTWTAVGSSAPITPDGEINVLPNSGVHTYVYSVSNACVSDIKRKFYLQALNANTPVHRRDTIAACYRYADNMNISQIFGLEAGGSFDSEPALSPPYLQTTSVGSLIFNGKDAYANASLPTVNYRGTTAKYVKFRYTAGAGSCLAGKVFEIVVVLRD